MKSILIVHGRGSTALGFGFSSLSAAERMRDALKWVGTMREVVDADAELAFCHPIKRELLEKSIDPSIDVVRAELARMMIL